MTVVWTTAFLDLPADRHGAGVAFWRAATRTELSPVRGDRGQFATLLPADGDAFLRVQELPVGPRIHLDLHVDDVPAAAADAIRLGAAELMREDHVVLASPGGFVFCLVRDEGERRRPGPVAGSRGGRSLVDQVCLDIPADLADDERSFWAALTGWPSIREPADDLVPLARPDGIPLRLLLQRLGPDDARRTVTAHLDVESDDRSTVVAEHVDLGATVLRTLPRWTVMRDPAGLVYCLTD